MNVWHARHQPGEKLLAATRLLKDIHLCHCDGGLKVANSSTLPDTTLTCSRKGASPNVTMSPPIVLKTNVLMLPLIVLDRASQAMKFMIKRAKISSRKFGLDLQPPGPERLAKCQKGGHISEDGPEQPTARPCHLVG